MTLRGMPIARIIWSMTSPSLNKNRKLKESDITGLKYFDQLAPLLERLHEDGCQRDRAGNRTLHYDQYGMLMLLYLFNPIVTSLRGIQQASELKNVQRKLGCARASLGSLSEATSVSIRNDSKRSSPNWATSFSRLHGTLD